MNRNFKGVWIPKSIWTNEELTIMEKLFLVEIDSLDNNEGCFASNSYFSSFFSISASRCSQIIKTLESKGMVEVELEKKEKQTIRRFVKVVNRINPLPTEVEITINPNKDLEEKERLFNFWWEAYNKKVGKGACKKKFLKLSLETCQKCLDVVSIYVSNTPDVKYRKNPITWLNQGCWDDEIVDENKKGFTGGNFENMVF
jgi:hypothetical protein